MRVKPPVIFLGIALSAMYQAHGQNNDVQRGQTNNSYHIDLIDTITIDASHKTARELMNEANTTALSNPVKSMKLASAALDKSIATGDKITQYQTYNTLGTLYYNISNYAKAAEYFRLAISGFANTNDPKGQAYAEKYLDITEKKIETIKTNSEVVTTNSTSEKRSSPKFRQGRSKTELLKRVNDKKISPEEKIDIYRELGDLYLQASDTAQAAECIGQVAAYSLSSSNKTLFANSAWVAQAYNSSGNFTENLHYQTQVLNEGLSRNSSELISGASFQLGTTYIAAQKPFDAIPFLKQSVSVAEKSGDLEQRQKSVKELARAYESAGQYEKALSVIKQYVHVMDSLNQIGQQNASVSLALNQEFLRQEQRIKNLIASEKQQKSDIKKQRAILWSLAAVLLVLGVLIYALLRNVRQKQKANMMIKLASLRTQMNPHFIFNSLNSVNNFISKNDERSANKYLSDFSKLMRTVLKNSDQDFITLATEIDTLKIYLDLEHFRFGDKFDYTLEVEDTLEPGQVEVPPMLIQPYIENAIWHGLRYKEEKGHLEVRFFTENEQLFCTVKDNGIGRKRSAELKTNNQKSYQSTGIKNTKERIDLLNKIHGTRLDIQIFDLEQNDQSSGTLVKISLPYILQAQEA